MLGPRQSAMMPMIGQASYGLTGNTLQMTPFDGSQQTTQKNPQSEARQRLRSALGGQIGGLLGQRIDELSGYTGEGPGTFEQLGGSIGEHSGPGISPSTVLLNVGADWLENNSLFND